GCLHDALGRHPALRAGGGHRSRRAPCGVALTDINVAPSFQPSRDVVIFPKASQLRLCLKCRRKSMAPTFNNSMAWQTKLLWRGVAWCVFFWFPIFAPTRGGGVNAAGLVAAEVSIYLRGYRF